MVYVFFAPGFEESEALVTVDMLIRGGLPVKMVSVSGDLVVAGAHNMKTVCDCLIEDVDCADAEALILPGGMPGVTNLYANETVLNAVRYCSENDLFVCAICAAPMILGKLGILSGKKATCFPGFEKDLEGATVTGKHVTIDGKVITAKGAGCALEFGFAIVAQVKGQKASDNVAVSMQCR